MSKENGQKEKINFEQKSSFFTIFWLKNHHFSTNSKKYVIALFGKGYTHGFSPSFEVAPPPQNKKISYRYEITKWVGK